MVSNHAWVIQDKSIVICNFLHVEVVMNLESLIGVLYTVCRLIAKTKSITIVKRWLDKTERRHLLLLRHNITLIQWELLIWANKGIVHEILLLLIELRWVIDLRVLKAHLLLMIKILAVIYWH